MAKNETQLKLLLLALLSTYATLGHPVNSTGKSDETCPPSELLYPCKCYQISKVVECGNVTDPNVLKSAFNRISNWKISSVIVGNSVMQHIPAAVIEGPLYSLITVENTLLEQLFERTPVSRNNITLVLQNVTFSRGFDWNSLSGLILEELRIHDVRIPTFGKALKNGLPKSVPFLVFTGTETVSITENAFSEFTHLLSLSIEDGYIEEVSRNMFPRPWRVVQWTMRKQRISVLPEDIFADLPDLWMVDFGHNLLKTVSEKTFMIQSKPIFVLSDNPFNCTCHMKWISKYTYTEDEKYDIIGECATPESLMGKAFDLLTKYDFRGCEQKKNKLTSLTLIKAV